MSARPSPAPEPGPGATPELDRAERERREAIVSAIGRWFAEAARPLPWRAAGTTPWAILVSEVMSQQTQVARVAPRWAAFLERWPTPTDFAGASDADAIRAWDRLGYPRRALRLRECAERIVADHGGEVPSTYAALLALPGLGPYTAGAVAAFAFGIPAPVVDTNVRRVLARAIDGVAQPWAPSARRDVAAWRGATDGASRGDALAMAAGAMELGALVCTARDPACERCPIADRCRWLAEGRPALAADAPRPRRPQARYEGSLRQMRGLILAELRRHGARTPAELAAATGAGDGTEGGPEPDPRFERALHGLAADRLVVRGTDGRITLPGD